jgi:glycosyltransferase involved in cell wall biosynthesis
MHGLFSILHLLNIRPFSFLYQKKSILYIEFLPIENAGYQYRAAKWATLLEKEGYKTKVVSSFPDVHKFELTTINDHNFFKFKIEELYYKTLFCFLTLRYETVVVRRELLFLNDYGNLFLDKFLNFIHPKVILDFDDDLAASKNEPREINTFYGKLMMENGRKFAQSICLYSGIIVSSNYLKELYLNYNKNVCVIPTCVDYDKFLAKKYDIQEELVFGWIGGYWNLRLLETIGSDLEEISKTQKIKLIVISNDKLKNNYSFPIEYIAWSLATEIESLYKIDIGLMPLTETKTSKGKGGFKLIQYMGLGIVSIASAVTINNEIVDDEVNSFLINTDESWVEKIQYVLKKKDEFADIGLMAKERIHLNYTFTSNLKKYLEFIQ